MSQSPHSAGRVPDGDPSAADATLLHELVDAILSADGAEAAVAAAAEWWTGRHSAPCIVGIHAEADRRLVVSVATGRDPPQRLMHDVCLALGPPSIRDELTRQAPPGGEWDWRPFADGGRVFGGILLARRAGAAPPSACFDLTARLLNDARLREERLLSEKLESLAEFAAGAGHEINNPLGTILGRVQLLARDEPHPERRRMLSTIGAQALRVRDMIGDVMLFARPPEPHPENFACATAVDEVIALFQDEARRRRVVIAGIRNSQVTAMADPVQFRIVVSELLRNAIRESPDGGEVRVDVQSVDRGGAPMALLEIVDQGPGLAEAERRHLFDPFFSGRQAGRGLGFGLPKCWRIVTMHGGCMHVVPSEIGLHLAVHWPGGT